MPVIVDPKKIDREIEVKSIEAINMVKKLDKEEGIFVGISSGANIIASLQIAKELGKNKNIVTILPDKGERYLSILNEHKQNWWKRFITPFKNFTI